ncbi:hypothetical protein FA95DRAFT_1607669 [Auriscalpium vulgare]|uniref:Uncharacterized protein n=1 Tax=Auriscalpium vulgare TaxID=40419 RepID=A0ACB8RND1_9AGAM|nr:hypothetical protein FA95DRAFT_1607669 [Auriscalpium vulgare]
MSTETPDSPPLVTVTCKHLDKPHFLANFVVFHGVPVALWACAWLRHNPLFLAGCAVYLFIVAIGNWPENPGEAKKPRPEPPYPSWLAVWVHVLSAGSALAWAILAGPSNPVVQLLLALIAMLAGGVFVASAVELLEPCSKCTRR